MTTQKMRISMAVLSRRAMEATVRCVTRVRAWGPSADDRGVEVARDGNGRALGERLVPWRGRRRDEEDVAGDLGTVGEGDGPEHTVLRTHGGNLVEELDVGGEALQHRKDVTRMFLGRLRADRSAHRGTPTRGRTGSGSRMFPRAQPCPGPPEPRSAPRWRARRLGPQASCRPRA